MSAASRRSTSRSSGSRASAYQPRRSRRSSAAPSQALWRSAAFTARAPGQVPASLPRSLMQNGMPWRSWKMR